MSTVATITIGGTTPQASASLPADSGQSNFWSTQPRVGTDPTVDVMELDFRNPRLINAIYIETAHFPHALQVQYLDPNDSIWKPMQLANKGGDATYLVTDSAPAKINVLSNQAHTQHYGPNHWIPITFALAPIETAAVRFRLYRYSKGKMPRDTVGKLAAYSLGLRNVQVGYEIYQKDDAPRYGDPTYYTADFAETTDLLGSPVSFSLTEDSPAHVLDSTEGSYWRSDPMPVNFAVVNFYVDVRDDSGNPQTIDKFFIDPLTVGAHMSVYWSEDEPDGNFEASDEPLAYPIVQLQGTSATPEQFPPHPTATQVAFSHVYPCFIDIDNHYLQWNPAKPFWFAFDINSRFLYPDGNTQDPNIHYSDLTHPIFSWGENVLQSVPGGVRFVNSQNQAAFIPFDPHHQLGSIWRIVVVYNTHDTADYPKGLTLIYQLGDYPAVAETFAMSPFGVNPGNLRMCGYPDTNNPGIPGISVRNFILKTTTPVASDIATYLADSVSYTHRASFAVDDTHTTDNSILRLDPSQASAVTCPAGLIGGIGDFFDDVVWTPVARDYTLKRGNLSIPPTYAKFFKFEFTNLIPETYENFVPITRSFKIFDTTTVQNWAAVTASTSAVAGTVPGNTSAQSLTTGLYSDAVAALQAMSNVSAIHQPTTALYAPNVQQAQQIAGSGWIWGFQPWHVGSSAPQFLQKTRHTYETVTVQHTTKVGFFAGIKSLQAFRVDYLVDNDTDEYTEMFTDQVHIASLNGVDSSIPGQLTSLSAASEVDSPVFTSTSNVRALQYAVQQSDPLQVLLDDYFTEADDSPYWQPYGDATLIPAYGSMGVSRGFIPLTYGDLEESTGTAGTLGSVVDSFDTGISDVWVNQFGTVAAVDGVVALTPTPTGSGIGTDGTIGLDLTASQVQIRSFAMPTAAAGGDTGQTSAELALISTEGTDSRLSMIETGGNLICRVRSSGTNADTTVTYDPAQLWWRIREQFGTIFWETSPDGATWNTQAQAPWPAFDITQLAIQLDASYTDTVAVPGLWQVSSVNLTAGQPGALGTYGNLGRLTYAQLEGKQAGGTAGGGMRSSAVMPLDGGQLYAAVRITATKNLTAPLRLSLMVEGTDEILASTTKRFYAGATDYFDVGYVVGSAPDPLTYQDLEGQEYGALEAGTYGSYESIPIEGPVYVRVDQTGPTSDSWTVERFSLYDQPISWSFSVDGGTTWCEALGIANNPHGVLTFPEPGTQLMWRLRMFAEGCRVSALAIRPWYAGMLHTRPTNTSLTVSGPNRSVVDQYPPIESDPMWQLWDAPIPRSWWDPVPLYVAPIVPPPPVTGGTGPTGGGGTTVGEGLYVDTYLETY